MERTSLQDFTEQEYTELARKILLAEFETTEGTDLICYPQEFNITTPQSMVNVVKTWRQQHGLPCFRDNYFSIAL